MKDPNNVVKEDLKKAFDAYEREPECSVVSVTDAILLAASRITSLEIRATADARLAITMGDAEAFEVSLPYARLSTFRSILARVGTICRVANEKRFVRGKTKAGLVRAGLVGDRHETEGRRSIKYVTANLPVKSPPLYQVDAQVVVRPVGGERIELRIEMRNNSQEPYLKLSKIKTA